VANDRLEDMATSIDETVKAVETALQATSSVREQKVYVQYDPEVAEEKAIAALHRMVAQKTPQPGDPTVPSPFVKVAVRFPPNPSVRVITPILGRLWLGTEAGVIVYDKAIGRVIETHPLLPRVRDIRYHRDKIWVLCDDQIAVYDREAGSWILISDRQVVEHTRIQNPPGVTEKLETIAEDWGINDCTGMTLLGNHIWLGRENGLKIYDTDSRRMALATKINAPEYLQRAEITALAVDEQDVWIGTRNGLFQYHSETGNWTPYTVLNGLAGNDISTIGAGEKSVWVGTAGEGLSRYHKASGKWESFNIDDGLSDNNIRSIALDGKYIWVGTFSAGVSRYDLTTELWTTYRAADNRTLMSQQH
jgi:ligand-binding sensor domain-containing protein